MKKIKEKEVADFVGVTMQTLRNWKKPIELKDSLKYLPPTGKHQLYKAAKLITYLLDYSIFKDKDVEEVSEHFNNFDFLKFNTEVVLDLLSLAKKDKKYYQELEKILKDLKEQIEEIEQIIIRNPLL